MGLRVVATDTQKVLGRQERFRSIWGVGGGYSLNCVFPMLDEYNIWNKKSNTSVIIITHSVVHRHRLAKATAPAGHPTSIIFWDHQLSTSRIPSLQPPHLPSKYNPNDSHIGDRLQHVNLSCLQPSSTMAGQMQIDMSNAQMVRDENGRPFIIVRE